jgi:hypothetical protein
MNMAALATRRHQEVRFISPRFVLLHSFAHLLINQLVQDCGYGSASLRERIYSADGDNPMAGILIYTAAGDSEGTMGGLVRMGQPDRLDDLVTRALNKAQWCSTDPVCIESKGQGTRQLQPGGLPFLCAYCQKHPARNRTVSWIVASSLAPLTGQDLGFFAPEIPKP